MSGFMLIGFIGLMISAVSANVLCPCARNWTTTDEGVTCYGPASYTGPCGSVGGFASYDDIQKQNWANSCNQPFDRCLVSPPNTPVATYRLCSCPHDWTSPDNGVTCYAPSSYTGPCGSAGGFVGYTEAQKHSWEASCHQTFDNCLVTDTLCPCPRNWTSPDGGTSCYAPSSYTGPCGTAGGFVGYTDAQKHSWEASCLQTFDTCPVVPEISFCKCPIGWTESGGNCTISADGNVGTCASNVSFAGYTNEQKINWAATCNSAWNKCYSNGTVVVDKIFCSCPVNWTKSGSSCVPPGSYTGTCGTIGFAGYTDAQKIAWATSCKPPSGDKIQWNICF